MKEQWKLFIFPLLLLLLVSVLAAFKIHGSSIGNWNRWFYGQEYKDPNLIFGQPRWIRTDEWHVSTPLTVSQAEAHFEDTNHLFLARQKLVLTDSPVKSWAAFEPQNWAFFLLPVEQAFAFRWCFNAFLLAVAVYFLTMALTEQNILVSSIAAIAFVYSPFIQWWYSTAAKEIAAFGILTFLFFIYLVNNLSRPLLGWVYALLFAYFGICFILTFYPPFQIPVAIIFSLAGMGYILSKRKEIGRNKKWRFLLGTTFLSLAAIGVVLILFYSSNGDAIQAMAHTSYPGSRQSVGKEDGFLLKAMMGFYNIQFLNRPLAKVRIR